jgi:hypothetical protein
MKSTRDKKGQNKSPCCVLWGDETQAVSHEKTRPGSTPHHAKTSLEGIRKQSHVAKPCGQKDTKDARRYVQVAKRYVRNKGESNQVSTR